MSLIMCNGLKGNVTIMTVCELKWRCLFVLICFFTHEVVIGKSQQIDSLYQNIETSISERDKVDASIKLVNDLCDADFSKALSIAQEALRLADQICYLEGKVQALLSISRFYKIKGDNRQSYLILQQVLSISKRASYREGEVLGYQNLGILAADMEDYKTAIENYEKALGICQAGGIDKRAADLLTYLGMVYFAESSYDQAIKCYEQALGLHRKIGDESEAVILLLKIGDIYRDVGTYETALDSYQEALPIYERIGDQLGIGTALIHIGDLYLSQQDYGQSIEYYKQALGILEQTEYTLTTGSLYIKIANVLRLGNSDHVFEYYNKALKIFKEIGNQKNIAITLSEMALAYLKVEKYDESIKLYSQSLNTLEEIGDETSLAQCLLDLGKVYHKQGSDLNRAKRYLKRSLTMAEEIGSFAIIKGSAQELATLERSIGNGIAAYDYHILYKQAFDSLFDKERIRASARLEAQVAFKQVKDSISNALERNELLLKQQGAEQRIVYYSSAIAIIFLLTMIILIYRHYESRKKVNHLLIKKQYEVEKRNKELVEMARQRTQLFSNISHELRTPLTLISGPLHSLISLYCEQLPIEAQRNIHLMKHNARKIQMLVDDILNLAKMETHKLEVHESTVQLVSFLNRNFESLRSLAESKKIEYVVKLEGLPEEYLLLDCNKVERIILNLLSNAIKFTPAGGSIEMNAIHHKEQILINVCDTGLGIPEKDLPFIFDRYFQSKQPETPLQGSSGIGLALSYNYSKLIGGKLSVESVEGEGSTFMLSLPCKRAPKHSPDKGPITKVTETGPKFSFPNITTDAPSKNTDQILVVEDHPEMLNFIKGLLSKHYKVAGAVNGKEALDYLSKHPVDLIVSDVMMPEMDGFTLLSTLRDNVSHQGIPVILLTALGDETNKIEALSMGVDDYLAKPFSPQELHARIDNMLNRYAVRKQMTQEDQTKAVKSIAPRDKVSTISNGGKKFIQEVEQRILAELENDDFSLRQLADEFCVSYSHFGHTLKKLTGLSPKQLQQEVALQKGRRLIEERQHGNLTAVARSVGMRNVTQFKKLYIRRFGKDPSEFFNKSMLIMSNRSVTTESEI